jgi:hypothetical protein
LVRDVSVVAGLKVVLKVVLRAVGSLEAVIEEAPTGVHQVEAFSRERRPRRA